MTNRSARPAVARSLGDGRYGIWVHYDDRLEAKALPGARWDPALKCWWVVQAWRAEADTLVARLNSRFERRPATSDPAELTAAFTALFAALAEPLRRPVHRALSKVLHPDQGGDSNAMRSLNDAWAVAP